MRTNSSVSLEIVTRDEWIQRPGGGGIQISIDGRRLNRFVDESNDDWLEDWYPDYAGTDVASDIWQLVGETTDVLRDNSVYSEHIVEMMEVRSTIIIESLGAGVLRIAFRVREPANRDSEVLRAASESACGYPVDQEAWGNAVLEAGEPSGTNSSS